MQKSLWYKNAVIYSLDLETFMDGNGDGVGDFVGLCNRLEYLHALGVDTVWLAPFFPSPNKDNGYDVANHYGVDPRHGCSGDFVNFIHKAKQLGLKVIIDLVVNHTSDQHPWFKEARKSVDNPMRDWYVWSPRRPDNWNEGMVFPGVQEATWTKDDKTGHYYFHRFYKFQPDLNTHHPAVRNEIEKIMGYWLQLGVDGFRVDALPFILEQTKPGRGRPALDFGLLKDMRRFIQWRSGHAILLGEANIKPEEIEQYFGEQENGTHLMFNFWVNQHTFLTLATGDAQPLIDALERTRQSGTFPQWAQFLRNHDELDLGRLTEKQRQAVFARFGPEQEMQLYERGIRRRLAPMLGSRTHQELAYSLLFSLPGAPVIRYGDEIGMGEDLSLKEREAVRTPMQWSAEKGAGFTAARKPVHPIIAEGPFSCALVNVEEQRRQPHSLLNWMTALIRLRKESPEIGYGEWKVLPQKSPSLLVMRYNHNGRCLLVLHNFDDNPAGATITVKEAGCNRIVDLMKPLALEADRRQRFRIPMDGYGYRWFRSSEKEQQVASGK